MPGKHDLTDSEAPSGGSSSKRKRSNDASSLPRSTAPARADDFDPEASEDEEGDEMDVDDEKERAEVEELARTQSNRPQKIAEAGVITQVDLQNFMCHVHTTVDFGPQVNFLVGVNGSGKSAVLTGITMALGGNAKATNRGQKGGDLIMEGKQMARCTVTLANKGDDAFQPHNYGDTIQIERTLNKNGSGAYKIKNHEGKTVDTKKATLDAILDMFNIQVDNPMTVLTQDQSRQFLASASPKDKYTFFLRGTQLAQLTEEYEQIRANTEQMDDSLSRKKEVLPEIKEAYRRAKERAKEAKAAIAQEGNLQTLKDQLVWAYVVEVEKQVAFGEREVAKESAQLAQHEEAMAAALEIIETAQGQIETLKEAEAESNLNSEGRRPRLEELNEILKAEKDRIKRWKDTERTLSGSLNRMKDQILAVDDLIAAEERKLSRDIEAERRPHRLAIERSNEEISELNVRITETRHAAQDIEEEQGKALQKYEDVKSRILNAQHLEGEARDRLANVQQVQSRPINAYGPLAWRVEEAVNRERRWHEKPIGPIGQLLKLNESQYASCLESFFHASLNGWIVTNEHDLKLMNSIKGQLRLDKNYPIFRQQFDNTFDLRGAEPHPDILTVMRALTFDNDLVRQALIVKHSIEKSALVPTRPDGDSLMRGNAQNVQSAFSADNYSIKINQGRSSSQTMAPWRGDSRFVRDTAAVTKQRTEDLNRIRYDIEQLMQEKAEAGKRCQAISERLKQSKSSFLQDQTRMRYLNTIIANAEAKLTEEQPSNINQLQQNKREIELELENCQTQFTAGKEAFERQTTNIEAVLQEKRDIEAKMKKAQKIDQQITSALEKEYKKISDAQVNVQRAVKKKEDVRGQVEALKRDIQKARDMLVERTEIAVHICARPPIEKYKEPVKLQKEIEAVEKALKEREKRQGATVAQIMEELERRKKTASQAIKDTNDLAGLIAALSAAYQNRILRWTDFRDHIGQRARTQFLAHLTHRNFTGKLRFDHDACKLLITVQTEDAGKNQKSKQKDAKSLSGGEKSFSTICLLLTMWEAVGCPIRCLDEFDVFMDAVNRRIAMRMMIETAKTADQTQFVLITPQEMSSISWGDEVRVVKLEDPKRSQGALAHGR